MPSVEQVNEAIRKHGIVGQDIGEVYSIAQRKVAQAI